MNVTKTLEAPKNATLAAKNATKNATLAATKKQLKPLSEYFKNAQIVQEVQKPMMAAQKPEKPEQFEIETSSMEMAQHKSEVHTNNKVLTKMDREEMQIQKEASDMNIDF